MKAKKVLSWALLAFFAYAIFTSPNQAANLVQTAWDIVLQGFQGIGAFFSALLNQT